MTISQKILTIMEEKNIKQKDLADYTGISSSAISDWKKKGTNPSVDKIGVIADYLGVSVDYLLGRATEPNENVSNSGFIKAGGSIKAGGLINVGGSINSPQYDEMTTELIKRFEELSFDEKLDVFNYLKNLK